MQINNTLFQRIFATAILLICIHHIRSQTGDFQRLDCHELQSIVENIFLKDLVDEKETKDQAPIIYEQLHLKECGGIAAAMNLLGLIYYNQNKLVQAKQILLAADTLLSVDSLKTKTYIRNQLYIGLVDLNEGRQTSAHVHFDKSRRISEEIGFKK